MVHRMRPLAGVAVLAVLASCSSSDPDRPLTEAELTIANVEVFQPSIAVRAAGSDQPSPDLQWSLLYDIANGTDAEMAIEDIDVLLPDEVVAGVGRLHLQKDPLVKPIDLYDSESDLQAARPAATTAPPLRLAPGERVVAAFHQTFHLQVDGTPKAITDDSVAAELGPWFKLPLRESGQYGCATGYPLTISVRTSAGTAERTVPHAVLPVGCELILPDVGPK